VSDPDSAGHLEHHLPLKPQWFHILLALSGEMRHGSGIVRAVLQETRGKLHLWPATLYGSLEHLSELGWVEEVSDPSERPPGESEKKRFYRITPVGARLLAAEAERLQTLATTALSRLGASTSGHS
jgi:DNA-binding PadR family transcriptional regulator